MIALLLILTYSVSGRKLQYAVQHLDTRPEIFNMMLLTLVGVWRNKKKTGTFRTQPLIISYTL